MDPIAYKIDHNPSLGHMEVLTLPSLVVNIIALQEPLHEFATFFMSPWHVCSTLSLQGLGVLSDTRLFPYRRLATQQTTFVPFLSLVEVTAQSLDCVPIYYEFFILNQETQFLSISYNYLLEQQLDFNHVKHCPIEF